jgi:hypothetical protein
MADNLNEQELQALFRKHLPMKQLPTDFAEQLKKQVLAEVATTLASKPVASVTTPEPSPAPTPTLERAPQRPLPHSVARTQPATRIGWLEWLRGSFRLTPSMATAGALVMVLCLVIVFGDQWLGNLPQPGNPRRVDGPSIISSATVTSTTAVSVAPTIAATLDGTPTESTAPSTSASDNTPTPTPVAPAQSNSAAAPETAVVVAQPEGRTITPVPSGGSVTPLSDPPFTLTPNVWTNDGNNPFAATPTAVSIAPVPPTRQSSASGTTMPNTSGEPVPTTTPRPSTVGATPLPTAQPGLDRATTPTTDVIRRPLATATPTPLIVQLTVASPTRTSSNGVPNSTVTPFEPSPSPTPPPTSTATATPTVGVTVLPWRTNTPTVTPTDEPTATATDEPTATVMATVPPTETATPEPSATATRMASPTPTNTRRPTRTATPLPTSTPLPTNTPRPTATDTATFVPTLPPTFTATATATDTPAPTATDTPMPTATNTSEPTATNTLAPTATNTPLPTATDTPQPTATNTPLPTATNTPLPTATDTPQPTATPTINATPVISSGPPDPATVDIFYSYTITATDPDGPPSELSIKAIEEIGWLSTEDLKNGELKLFGTPSITDIGIHRFKIQIFDAFAMTEQEIEVTVQSAVTGSSTGENPYSTNGEQPPAENPTPTETPTVTN